jgi:hypothetical protein
VARVTARRDASVVGDSGACRRGTDLTAARLSLCGRAEAADEGDGREQQDKAGPEPLWPGRLLNHAKPLSGDAVAVLRDGTNSPMRRSASRYNRARHLWVFSSSDPDLCIIT